MKKGLAVIVVDMQDFFLKNFPDAVKANLINEQSKVIDFCKVKSIPLVILEYKAGGQDRGRTTLKLLQKIKKNSKDTIIKESNSGFTGTSLEDVLKAYKINKLLLMGINANGCVQDTAIAAIHRGYVVITSAELMASAPAGISNRNKKWYMKNTNFFESTKKLISHLEK